MFEQKKENSGKLVFCNKCTNFEMNDYADSCLAPENFDHYGTVSEKTKYWKDNPCVLNKDNNCSYFVLKESKARLVFAWIISLLSFGAVIAMFIHSLL